MNKPVCPRCGLTTFVEKFVEDEETITWTCNNPECVKNIPFSVFDRWNLEELL